MTNAIKVLKNRLRNRQSFHTAIWYYSLIYKDNGMKQWRYDEYDKWFLELESYPQ